MRARGQHGFTYLGVIILVAIIGLVGAAGAKFGAIMQRRAAEQALLDIGAQFSDALRSYADATPAGQPTQPPSLKELLKDPRFPVIHRHLRKLFVDPVTGKAEWGVVYVANQVGVLAVYSLSSAKPIKQGNFDVRFPNFDGKAHLSDWRFSIAGQGALQAAPLPPVSTPPGSTQPGVAPAPATPPAGGAAPASAVPDTPAAAN